MRRKKFSIRASQIPDLKSVLEEMMKGSNLRGVALKGVIVNSFQEVIESLNPIFVTKVELSIIDLRSKMIEVKVKNSTIRNEIFMYRSFIVEMVNQKVGRKVINRINFR